MPSSSKDQLPESSLPVQAVKKVKKMAQISTQPPKGLFSDGAPKIQNLNTRIQQWGHLSRVKVVESAE